MAAAGTVPSDTGRFKRVGDLRSNRLLLGVLALLGALALFVYFFRLGAGSWLSDELYYREAAHSYMRGDFSVNRENTLLAKYLLGATQLVFGDSLEVARTLAALAGFLTGIALFLLGWRMAGPWVGVIALALWWLLPHPEILGEFDVGRIKIERYFRLEVFMGLFLALSMLCAWIWSERGNWRWAVATGVAVGLSAASKAPGILILPAVALVGLVSLPFERRTLAQAAAVCVLPFVVVAITYVPLGLDAFDAIDGMFYVDSLRNEEFTTPFVFSGHFYENAPWWSNLWWQWKSLGTPAAVSGGILLVLAPFLIGRRALVLLGVGLAVPLFFFLVRLDYALPYYYYAWQPQLVIACALVLGALAARGRLARAAAVALAIPLLVAAIGTVRDVGDTRSRDFAAAAEELGPRMREGTVVAWGLETSNIMRAELPGATVILDPNEAEDVSAVVVDRAVAERRFNPIVTKYLREHRDELQVRRFDRLNVYLPRDGGFVGG